MNIKDLKGRLKNNALARKYYDDFRIYSIKSALKRQKLLPMFRTLNSKEEWSVQNQYSKGEVISEYVKVKIKALHAFQMCLVMQGFLEIKNQTYSSEYPNKDWKVIDLGDSSGLHLQYIKALLPHENISTMSVNVDQKATDRIGGKGMLTCCTSIENYVEWNVNRSNNNMIFMFETLEHLHNPIRVLDGIKKNIKPKMMFITVPYVRQSRVGLHHLRNNLKAEEIVNPETTHIFELSPYDWGLLFKYCGFKVVDDAYYTYYQYPSYNSMLRKYWEAFDFEGFVGFILK